jgi:hypothetical protein
MAIKQDKPTPRELAEEAEIQRRRAYKSDPQMVRRDREARDRRKESEDRVRSDNNQKRGF